MDTTDKKAVKKLVKLLGEVREEHGDIPIQMLETLLQIALNEGSSQLEIQNLTKQSKASSSRNIKAWSGWTRHREVGPGYIEAKPDPYEMRRNVVSLTKAGERYLTHMAKVLREG